MKLQAFQIHAAQDMLGVFTRYVGALGSARGASAIGDAQKSILNDWIACMESLQREWSELALAVPPEAWSALGWRIKPGAQPSVDAGIDAPLPKLLEQAELSIEMLLRPWVGAPDLAHADEFVA